MSSGRADARAVEEAAEKRCCALPMEHTRRLFVFICRAGRWAKENKGYMQGRILSPTGTGTLRGFAWDKVHRLQQRRTELGALV